jgi:protocatechuate 3,4-dioxygenase beta subunit
MPAARSPLVLIAGIVLLVAAALSVYWLASSWGDAGAADAVPVIDGRPGPGPEPILPDAKGPRPEPPKPPPDPRRLGSVSGRLVTPDRRVVSAAHIETYTGTPTGLPGLGRQADLGREVDVDTDGRFQITELPETEDLLLLVKGASFAITESGPFRVEAGGDRDLGDIIVEPGMRIAGSIVDASEKPVPGAHVRFYQMPGDAMYDLPQDAEVVSDERGLFGFPHVRVATFTLRVTAEGYANARVLGDVTPGQQLTELPVKVRLKTVAPLTGMVHAKLDRSPIEGATVEAVPLDPDNDGGRGSTDADGTFVIGGIAAGNYVVTAVAEGFAKRSERTWADSYSAPIQLVLPEQGTLTGVVVGEGGEPVRNFELQARFHRRRLDPPSPRFNVQRFSSEDGSFVIKNLDGGHWCVQAWAQGYALTDSPCMMVAQGHEVGGLLVQLRRGATLAARVVDRDGTPVPGARVSLHTNREPEIAFLRDTDPDATLPPAVYTRTEGTFRFTGLAERLYQLEIDHPGFARVRLNDVRAVAGVESDLGAFTLERGSSISGTALSPGGQPLSGVAVHLAAGKDGTGGGQTTTDGQGRFTFTRLLPGEYQLTCFGRNPSLGAMLSAAVGDNKPTPFLLEPGQDLRLNVTAIE